MRTKRVTLSAEVSGAATRPKLFASIREGLRYTLRDPAIRSLTIILSVIEFAFAGPLTVGLAALANSKFAGGSKAFGIMVSTLGGGFLLGTLIANWFKGSRIGFATYIGALMLGGLLVLLGLAPNLVWACVILAATATIGGFLQVLNAVWFQTRPAPHMLGRVMSVVMLFGFGLTPLSYLIAGALVKVSPALMFTANGLFLLTAILLLLPARRKIDEAKPMTVTS